MDWRAFVSTFGLLLVAELGDKTQLAVVTQTCTYRKPWPVFLGASVALILVSGLSVVVGDVLAVVVPMTLMRFLAALAFVVIGGWVFWQSTRKQGSVAARDDDCNGELEEPGAAARKSFWDWRAFGSTLSLLLLAELGDKTQLSLIALSSELSRPWMVFLGGSLALIGITALGVAFGSGLAARVPRTILLRVSAVGFVVVGGLIGFNIL